MTSRAKQAMANRTIVTFGKAYLRHVNAVAVTDREKLISHAVAIGAGSAKMLAKYSASKLCILIAEKLKQVPKPERPRNAPCIHVEERELVDA